MLIIGCDFHPGFQQVAIFDNQTGSIRKNGMSHRRGGAVLPFLGGQKVRVGWKLAALSWFERLLAELAWSCGWGCGKNRAVWCAAEDGSAGRRAFASAVREIGFRGSGCRRWKSGTRGSCWCIVTSGAARTRTKNQLHALALSQGVQKKRKL